MSCQPEVQPGVPAAAQADAEDAPQPPVWVRFEEARRWPVASEVFPSEHLGAARYATVRIWPGAKARYRDLVARTILPEGTAALEALSTRPGSVPSGYFAMEKAVEGWTYWALDASGRGNADTSGLCQRCHAEALADELFGPRRAGTKPAGTGP